MTDTSWLEIDASALRHNMSRWRDRLAQGAGDQPPPLLCAVAKADGYGLGGAEVARQFQAAGADVLAVFSPDQADALLEAGVTTPILVLMPVRTKPETLRLYEAIVDGRLHLTVDAPDQLILLDRIGLRCRTRVPVHLAVDTGMCRGGLTIEQLRAALRALPRLRHVELAGVWTHFSSVTGDAATMRRQWTAFRHALRSNAELIGQDVIRHAAATGATLADPLYHFDMVRLGLGLLGMTRPVVATDQPRGDDADDLQQTLRPALRWRSRIIHVRRYPKGARVGYDGTHQLSRDSFLGLVPVGYGDGYPTALSNRGVVKLIGRDQQHPMYAPVVGRVNMDQIIIDLTHPSAPPDHSAAHAAMAHVEDMVELISPSLDEPTGLPRLAALAETSAYELLCRLSPRLPRIWRHAAPADPAVILSQRNHSAA